MKATEARVRRLEAEHAPGKCSCANPSRVVYPAGYIMAGGEPAPQPRAERCEVCGGERATITVEYAEHWTTFEYHGERERLQTDDTGRVVFSYDAAVAAICDHDESAGR